MIKTYTEWLNENSKGIPKVKKTKNSELNHKYRAVAIQPNDTGYEMVKNAHKRIATFDGKNVNWDESTIDQPVVH